MLELTNENFEKQALEAGRPVLVEFWAPWCGYCRRIAPVLDNLAQVYEGDVTIAKLNIDEAPGLAERYGVETIPALMLFQNGKHSEKLVAPGSKAQIDAFIAENR